MIQEFWDYDETAREKARTISHEFRKTREKMLEEQAKKRGNNKKAPEKKKAG